MRHFDFLDDDTVDRLFLRAPEEFDVDADPQVLGAGLGATLYCPGTRPALADDLIRRRAEGLQAAVVCLEDAVPDAELARAERNAAQQLAALARRPEPRPLVFVRVRSSAQIPMLTDALGADHAALTGFVVPKFDEDTGDEFLGEVTAAAERLGRRLLVMPVLETAAVAHAESRLDALLGARRLVDKYRDLVPAVRVGGTDISGVYGLRRPREFTVWDVRVLGDALGAIVNVFGRDDAGYAISGAVWEYFPASERMFKPQLRETPFIAHDEPALRARLLAAGLDGLIREVELDRANGLTGKTVIHPAHVPAVHALSVVSAEEYADATDVLATNAGGGAAASSFGNKMNESKPHTAWARRVAVRARVFGVARPETTFVELLGAGWQG